MINNQLLGYVKQQLSLNVGKSVIIANLKSGGWNESDINEVFIFIETNTTSTSATASSVKDGEETSIPASLQVNFASPTTHKSKKMITVIAVLILLCLVGGIASYAYYTGMFVTLPSLLSQSIDDTKTTTSEKYSVVFNVDFSDIKSANTSINSLDSLSSMGINSKKFSLNMNGSSDISDIKNPKFSSIISFNLGDAISVEAELRLIDKVFYAQLSKAPTLGTLSLLIPNISQYVNKWFSIPISTLSSLDSKLASSSAITLTDEQRGYIRKMFRDSNFIKPIAKLSTETVSGEASYHFSFDLNKDAFLVFVESFKNYMQTIDKNNPQYSTFDSKLFTSFLDQVKDFKGEIWIGRNDKLVHKITLDFDVQVDPTKNEKIKFNLVTILSDYNQPVSIVAPAESSSFETLVNDSIQKGKETSIKADMSNMSAQAKIFYNKNKGKYSGFCLSKELKNARTDIETNGGTGFICKDKTTAYVVGVKLSDGSGNWCVDSKGANKSTKTLPLSTVCPAI
jgi:hypothetical protein